VLKKTALVAIGGNSLIPSGEEGSFEGQQEHARQTARGIAGLMADGWRVLVTHGNGPQVGAALLRSERGSGEVYPLPLHACGATTQGEIGYILQQALADALAEREIGRPVATVLTQVVVSADDPAFGRPTKPIGPFYTREQADARRRRDGWTLVEDPVHGFRRVVASPEPVEIVEAEVIRALVDRGVLVVALGGGGIPVIRRGDRLVGVDAVIDKDRASALLASRLRVERLVISTAVDHISVDYGLPSERPLGIVTADELERHYRNGQFPAGSMGPKVEAALRFLRDGGGEVVVTSPALLRDAVAKSVGTHIVSGAPTGGGQPVAATTGWTSGR
jgi:carbamate kinase